MVEVAQSDHARGCEGRNYTCTCGFDDQQEARVAEAEQRGKIEGARLAIEAAADWITSAPPHLSMQEYAAAIRALSPAKIVGEG